MSRAASIVRWLVGLGAACLLCWLALAPDHSSQRIEQINALVVGGELGSVNPELQRRLEAQFAWLAKHAGVRGRVAVNEPLDKRRLTLLVTRPKHEALTFCGAGNAIFDPSLNAILVDEGLVWPEEVNIIGSPSVNTMFTISSYGYITSYTNFIMAHELGHWARQSRGAAFFYYGWNEGTSNLAEEKAADAAAARTLLRAREAGDEPSLLRQLNTLDTLGLRGQSLTPRQFAIADILGGISLMTNDLLFSSSPFSPHYSDASHPTFLERVSDALKLFEGSDDSRALAAQLELVRARLSRLRLLGQWRHRELFLPGPLTAADVRQDSLWLGRTDIPTLQTDELDEHIYRLDVADLLAAQSRTDLSRVSPVRTGRSKVGKAFEYAENYGKWVESSFEQGIPEVGLPPPDSPKFPQKERLFGRNDRGGFNFLGMGWRWPSSSGGEDWLVTEKALAEQLRRVLPQGEIALGQPQLVGGHDVVVPVSKSDHAGAELRLFRISSTEPLALVEVEGFPFQRANSSIEISAVRHWRYAWWVPLRLDAGRPRDRMELWKVQRSGATLFGGANFVSGDVAGDLPAAFRELLGPKDARFVPIGPEQAVFGYDNDSLFVVDERLSRLRLLFYPSTKGLNLLELGHGRILLWTLHARKAYLIDVSP